MSLSDWGLHGDILRVCLADCEDPAELEASFQDILELARRSDARRVLIESTRTACEMGCAAPLPDNRLAGELLEAGITHVASVCIHGPFALTCLTLPFRHAGGQVRGFYTREAGLDWLSEADREPA